MPLPDSVSQLGFANRADWRSGLLRFILSALATTDANRCVDRALDVFLEVLDASRSSRFRDTSDPIRFVTLWLSMVLLRTVFCRKWQYNTSPSKFERFVECFARRKHLQGRQMYLAELDLFHPTNPSPDKMLELCCSESGIAALSETKMSLDQSPKSQMSLNRVLNRAIAVLHGRNRFDDAQWLRDFKVQLFGQKRPEQPDTSLHSHFPDSFLNMSKVFSS